MMQKKWLTDKNLTPIHLEVLQAMIRESIQVVENVELASKITKTEQKMKIKDAQIHKLREQIAFRDELLDEARRLMRQNGLKHHLEDRRISDLGDLHYDG